MAFRGDSTDTYTYSSGSTGGTVDLGARNNYRYINATNVYNKGKADGYTTHTGTYTFPSNDTGGTKDLGVNHTYRYVNATNVYNKGKSDGDGNITSATKTFDISLQGNVPMDVVVGKTYSLRTNGSVVPYLTRSTVLYDDGATCIIKANSTGQEQTGSRVYTAIQLS